MIEFFKNLWHSFIEWLKGLTMEPPPTTGDAPTEDDPPTEDIPPEPEPDF